MGYTCCHGQLSESGCCSPCMSLVQGQLNKGSLFPRPTSLRDRQLQFPRLRRQSGSGYQKQCCSIKATSMMGPTPGSGIQYTCNSATVHPDFQMMRQDEISWPFTTVILFGKCRDWISVRNAPHTSGEAMCRPMKQPEACININLDLNGIDWRIILQTCVSHPLKINS